MHTYRQFLIILICGFNLSAAPMITHQRYVEITSTSSEIHSGLTWEVLHVGELP